MFWSKRQKGERGEELAVSFLKKNGYKILERNYTAGRDEIDVIAFEKKTGTLCFVEVKYRTGTERGLPVDAVDRSKRGHILRAAKTYLKARKAFGAPYRFDVVSVVEKEGAAPEIDIYRNSFVPSRSGWTGGDDSGRS